MNNAAQAKGWIAAAAVSGAVSVMAGAFAAHGLDPVAEAKAIGWLHMGSTYEAVHALAILAVAALAQQGRLRPSLALAAQILFLGGSLCFCGALYALALQGPHWLGMVAPLGGSALILGWLTLALAALTGRRSP